MVDFSNRNVQTQAAAPGAQHTAAGTPSVNKKKLSDNGKWARIGVVAAVAAVVILLISSIAVMVFGRQ